MHVGDRVTNTTPLTTIDERNGLEVYISIPSEHARDVKLGAPVEVIDKDGKVLLRTAVYFISPQVETGTQSILVKAPADQGGGCAAHHATGARPHCLEHAHRHHHARSLRCTRVSGQFFAFVAESEQGKMVAHQRPLQLGEIVGNDYVVLSGLKTGDKVVVSGGQNLADGMPVQIEQ